MAVIMYLVAIQLQRTLYVLPMSAFIIIAF